MAIDAAYVCGPFGMIDDGGGGAGASCGVPAERVHVERFSSALRRPAAARSRRSSPRGAAIAIAAVIVDGARTEVPVAEGEAVLDAAMRAGLDLPFSCKGGMCSTCRAKVVEGDVAMAVNYSLEPWETEAGFVLTCQARPTSAARGHRLRPAVITGETMVIVTVTYPAEGSTASILTITARSTCRSSGRYGVRRADRVQFLRGTGAPGGGPVASHLVAMLEFPSEQEFQRAAEEHGKQIMADIKNFTDVKPVLQLNEATEQTGPWPRRPTRSTRGCASTVRTRRCCASPWKAAG